MICRGVARQRPNSVRVFYSVEKARYVRLSIGSVGVREGRGGAE